VIKASGGYYNAPADQLRVAAAIKLNGQTVTTGSRSVSIGDGHYVVVDLLFPGATQPATLFHTVFAGGYYGLGPEYRRPEEAQSGTKLGRNHFRQIQALCPATLSVTPRMA
jgi:hypothetical protein